MPGVDWIPGVSQLKSGVQLICGDIEGAARTAENFAKECPVVSQVTSAIQLVQGDTEGALETQRRCLDTLGNVANGIPVVGHGKGLIQHAYGDHEGGNQALNAATRSTVVIASGAAAGIATGGLGAIPAGIAAGASYDTAATVITGEEQGYIAAIKNVAENPSPGAVFDAVAIPVGDGLAGYAGGKLGKQMQLNSLENAKLSALEKMEAAETSIERMHYSDEAMSYHVKSNQIKHGTPVFWDDPKTGTSAPGGSSSSNAAMPVPGYVNENNEGQEEGLNPIVIGAGINLRHVIREQLDALHYDSYVETAVYTEKTRKEAQAEMYKRDEQEPQGDLRKLYSDVRPTTPKKINDLLDPNRDPDRKPNWNGLPQDFVDLSWLSLIMPEEFPYTAVAQLNSCRQGLEHSFIRHIQDWAAVIPTDFLRVSDRLSPIRMKIEALSAAIDTDTSKTLRQRLVDEIEALKRHAPSTYNDIRSALVEIQMAMYRFIQDNMTYENYQGRSENMRGDERFYFKVKTENGVKVMVLCLTNSQYEPMPGDDRPVRILITAYFESWKEFNDHGLLETKKEMEKRRKKK